MADRCLEEHVKHCHVRCRRGQVDPRLFRDEEPREQRSDHFTSLTGSRVSAHTRRVSLPMSTVGVTVTDFNRRDPFTSDVTGPPVPVFSSCRGPWADVCLFGRGVGTELSVQKSTDCKKVISK